MIAAHWIVATLLAADDKLNFEERVEISRGLIPWRNIPIALSYDVHRPMTMMDESEVSYCKHNQFVSHCSNVFV